MFYKIYIELCKRDKVDPYSVPLKIGYKSNSVVAQWATGSVPRGKYLDELAKFFNVSIQYLLGLDEKTPLTQEGEGLTDIQREAVDFIGTLSDDELRRFIAMGRAAFGKDK